MPTKLDIKKILSKGLTAVEAGRLIFQDNWLTDTRRGGFLSQKDMASIRASMRSDRDAKIYNSYISLYRIVDYTLKDAKIAKLEAENYLEYVRDLISSYLRAEAVKMTYMFIPAIVTQKQYEELSAKQRLLQLEHVISLEELISYLSGVELDYLLEDDKPEPVIDFQKDEKLIQAVQKIKELLKAGKLKPLKMSKWEEYYDSHKLKIPAQPVKEVMEMLDKLLSGELQYDEDDSIRLTVFRAKNLYGLEEMGDWIKKLVDTYEPNLEETTSARPADMMQSEYVAIVQNPASYNLDKRGYWIEKDYLGELIKLKPERDSELLMELMDAISERIKLFMAMQAVLEALSGVIGVDFLEDLTHWGEELKMMAGAVNKIIKAMDGRWESAKLSEVKPFKLGKLKASSASIRYFRERMAIALGDKWWDGEWWDEAVHTLKLEGDEPDSLAQELSDELDAELAKTGGRYGE